MSDHFLEIKQLHQESGLAARVLNGTVIVLRNGLQQLGLFDQLVNAGLSGIRESLGADIAERVEKEGFERIHEMVGPGEIPAMTDTVYGHFEKLAPQFLDSFVPRVFPGEPPFYFEHNPNVRFHIPYDVAAPHRKQYDKFAEKHGQGKIAPHGPHRDSWLDCPDNAINLWIAVGPVQKGNGLSIFADDRDTEFSFRPNGEIALGERMNPPLNFDLSPGDVLIFHSDALHASELNRTDSTRFAVSFRVTFGKPHFPNGHYHHYDSARLAGGMARGIAGLPANLQWSYFAYRLNWLKRKLFGSNGTAHEAIDEKTSGSPSPGDDKFVISIADLPVGSIRAVSNGICIARLDEDEVVALSRRCPHKGADLVEGFIEDRGIVCPWHNLHFDPETGASACEALKPLRRYSCEIVDDQVVVSATKEPTNS